VGDDVDAAVTGRGRDPGLVAHGLQQLGDEVLEVVPR
jgi:predicted GNAT family acetyltransferase